MVTQLSLPSSWLSKAYATSDTVLKWKTFEVECYSTGGIFAKMINKVITYDIILTLYGYIAF